VVEAWATEKPHAPGNKTTIGVCINRTPTTGLIAAARDNRDIDAFGCGLKHTIAKAPKTAQFSIVLNITTPWMPITSDGKEPNLPPFLDGIYKAVDNAVRKAHNPNATGQSQKDVVLDNLDEAIAAQGGMRFNERQIFYFVRDIVKQETGKKLKIGNFKTIMPRGSRNIMGISPVVFVIGVVIFLEFALFYLAYTDYTMTNAGLIYDGVDKIFSQRLALAGVCFMFLIWTVVLNLGELHTLNGFLKLLPVMILIIIISYATAGQWILVKLASVEAIRQSSADLKREVDAYLAPVKRPAELLTSLADQLKSARERFANFRDNEIKGAYTKLPGAGPAVERLNSVATAIGVAQQSVTDLKKRWEDLDRRSNEQRNDLSQRVERGGVATAMEVESTLQNIIRDLRAFPFSALRPGV
jgi:hypothetical protein